jgi:hypothetical protein
LQIKHRRVDGVGFGLCFAGRSLLFSDLRFERFDLLVPGIGGGAVAELVGIEGGVVSGVINLESSGVEASDWRPRHDEPYHEG